jgi:HAD superfamily hydrolase (TIGR01509 family)
MISRNDTPLSPSTTILAFDLHEVLVTNHYTKMFWLWWNYVKKWSLLYHLVHPRIIILFLRLRVKRAVAENILFTLIEKYPLLAEYQSLSIQILNAQKPIPHMEDVLIQLKKIGFELHLFSNIGEQLFNHLAPYYPSLFKLFDVIQVAESSNNYLGKPNPKAFEQYLMRYNKAAKQIIFVDDKCCNIHMAQRFGIIGIRFHSYKRLIKKFNQLLPCKI